MKTSYQILLIFLVVTIGSINAQIMEKDSLIQLYPGLADTIDKFDREYFELFQNIEGYQNAVFYVSDDSLKIQITYLTDELLTDTIWLESLSYLESIRMEMNKKIIQGGEKVAWPEECVLLTKDGDRFDVSLVMFSRSYLYFVSEKNLLTNTYENFRFKLPIAKVHSLIYKESTILGPVALGAGVGLLGGILAQTAGGNSNEPISRGLESSIKAGVFIIAVALGAMIGLVIGLASSGDEEIIVIQSEDDLVKLKNYTKYHFKYDQSIEERYVELE